MCPKRLDQADVLYEMADPTLRKAVQQSILSSAASQSQAYNESAPAHLVQCSQLFSQVHRIPSGSNEYTCAKPYGGSGSGHVGE